MHNPLPWLLPLLMVLCLIGLIILAVVHDTKKATPAQPAADRVLATIPAVLENDYFDPNRLASELGWSVGTVIEQLDKLEADGYVCWQRHHPPDTPKRSTWTPEPPVCRRYWLTPEGEREAKWCEVEAVEQLGRTPCLQ